MFSLTQTKDYKIEKKSRLFRLKANIVGSKLIHQSGFHHDYIEYYLQMETDYLKWSLKKRYEDFNKFNTKLIELIPELKKFFPPKRLFKSSDKTVSERIKLFNKYLNYLFCNINIFLIDDIMDFISLKKEIVELFIKKYNMLRINEDNYVLKSLKKACEKIKKKEELKKEKERIKRNNFNSINIEKQIDNYYEAILDYEIKRQNGFDWDEQKDVTPNLIVIKEFLNNLSEKLENNTEILQSFEKFLNKGAKWTKLSSKEIKILYIGEEGSNNILEASRIYLSQNNNLKKRK